MAGSIWTEVSTSIFLSNPFTLARMDKENPTSNLPMLPWKAKEAGRAELLSSQVGDSLLVRDLCNATQSDV